jgi:REP element-mobilizing transposase RayT
MHDDLLNPHRRSTRLEGRNYAQPGTYYVTILTHERECLLGDIVDGEMRLSEIGKIAQECWMETPKHFPNASLDEFRVMPNHLHGILVLNKVRTRHAVSLPRTEQFGKPVPGSIPTIIRSFKSAATKSINEFQGSPGDVVWHGRFHDHIICDTKDLIRIRRYIQENPMNWQHDDDNPRNRQ